MRTTTTLHKKKKKVESKSVNKKATFYTLSIPSYLFCTIARDGELKERPRRASEKAERGQTQQIRIAYVDMVLPCSIDFFFAGLLLSYT